MVSLVNKVQLRGQGQAWQAPSRAFPVHAMPQLLTEAG